MKSLVAFNHPLSEALEAFSLQAAQEFNQVSCDLEWCNFKVKKARVQDKAKVDVDQAAVQHVYKDVGIVPVFDLEDVAD